MPVPGSIRSISACTSAGRGASSCPASGRARAALDIALSDRDAGKEEIRDLVRTARDATLRSEEVVAGLLALAQGEGGLRRRESVALDRMAADVIEQLGVEVEADLRPAPVEGDPALLERVAANLMHNAVRYNNGRAWVRVETDVVDGSARLIVANTGESIAPEDVEGLFTAFHRRDASRSRDGGGAGLGLAIVRALAEAHGGTATASARNDGGLRVAVELPASSQYRGRGQASGTSAEGGPRSASAGSTRSSSTSRSRHGEGPGESVVSSA